MARDCRNPSGTSNTLSLPPYLLPPWPPYKSNYCDGRRSCVALVFGGRFSHCIPWCICCMYFGLSLFFSAPIHLCASGSAPFRRQRATPRHICLHSCLRASGAPQPQKGTHTRSRHSILSFLLTLQVSKFIAFLCAQFTSSFSLFLNFFLHSPSACALSLDSFGTPNAFKHVFSHLFQGHA